MANSTIGVRLSEEIRNRLNILGRARSRTPHYLMRLAIERFLDVEEALEAEHQLVKERWRKFELTNEVIDHNDMKVWADKLRSSELD